MKNLFKNLMLVAVAAMAFTACQNDNSEIDTLAKTRVVTFTANIGEDTRSGFTGKVGNVYKSAWDGDEMLYVKAENTEKWPTISADGTFQVEFNAGDSFVSIYSPVASWEYNTSYYAYMPVVPTEQTPRANSVDPAAHILSAQNVPIGETGEVAVSMQHQVAYGKMTVDTPAEFEITKVVLNLKGAYYGVDKDLTYTLVNDGAIENNTFWFATEPLKVSEFTITAHGSDGKMMAKTVAVDEDKLNFNYGCVSTFSVVELEEYVAPAAPAFTSAYTGEIGSYHDFYMYFEDSSNNLKKLQLNPYYAANTDLTFTPGTYYIKNSAHNFWGEEYSTYGGTYLYGGTINISVVNKQYHFEFIDLTDGNGNVVLKHATYTGSILGLDVPDLRTALTMPAPEAEKTGDLTATISWKPIDGAVGYKVACNCGIDVTTTDTSIELTFPEYGTHYVFVTALAAEDDVDYKNSDTAVATLVLKDPNILADYIMDTIVWDDSGERFKLTNAAQYPSYVYIRFNEADCPGRNSIKVGDYTGAGLSNGTTTVPVGQFTARVGWDMWTIDNWDTFTTSTTVNVSYADNAYTIVLTDAFGRTFGYKGRPDGWVAPAGGGDDNTGEGGDDNTGEGGDDNTGEGGDDNTGEGGGDVPDGYIEMSTCIYYGDLMGAGLADEFVLLSADGNNKLFFNINNTTSDANYIPTGEYTIASVGSTGFKFNMSYLSDTTKINGQLYANGVADDSGSTMSVVSEGAGGIHEIKLTIINNQGTNKFYYKGTIN